LIYLVIGTSDVSVFLRSGEAHARNVILATLKRNGLDMKDFGAVLDFGCGCGRILRHWAASEINKLCGTDYNPKLVNWCRWNLPFASVEANELYPPLRYDRNVFHFVYARSVFTHLSEALQAEWFAELRRILAPGGVLLFTVSGGAYLDAATPAERGLFAEGHLVVREAGRSGANVCAVFHPETWVRQKMAEYGWTIVDFVPGHAEEFLYQDTYLVRKSVAGKTPS
jgi:SAM-dependent methyltransferase